MRITTALRDTRRTKSRPKLREDAYEPLGPLPAGQGMEDAFDVLTDINDDGFFEPFGTFWYGGFTCDRDANGIPGDAPHDYRPYAQFFHVLYGPDGGSGVCCCADMFPAAGGDGVLNFFDIARFLTLFNARDPLADFFPTNGGDGIFDFFDISTFIAELSSGCP